MEKEKGCAKCYYVKKGISFYLVVFMWLVLYLNASSGIFHIFFWYVDFEFLVF